MKNMYCFTYKPLQFPFRHLLINSDKIEDKFNKLISLPDVFQKGDIYYFKCKYENPICISKYKNTGEKCAEGKCACNSYEMSPIPNEIYEWGNFIENYNGPEPYYIELFDEIMGIENITPIYGKSIEELYQKYNIKKHFCIYDSMIK